MLITEQAHTEIDKDRFIRVGLSETGRMGFIQLGLGE